jgi:NAD(P)H-hydrate epimerase
MEVKINGRKYRAVSAAEMREMDRRAIEEYGIPGLILMENAGGGAAELIAKSYRERKCAGPVVVLCGKGNNGGDGFVIARRLHNAGLPVKVFFLGQEESIDPKSDAGINYTIIKKMKLDVRPIAGVDDVEREIGNCKGGGILVDALLGTGLKNKVGEPIASVIARVNAVRPYTVAIDAPSGLDCTTGEILGCAVIADETITFALPKQGFFKADGPHLVGELRVVEISLPREIL